MKKFFKSFLEDISFFYRAPGSNPFMDLWVSNNIGSSGWVEGGGARNMKSMWPPLVAVFFMTYFYRAWGGGGAWPPRPPPPGSAPVKVRMGNQTYSYLAEALPVQTGFQNTLIK